MIAVSIELKDYIIGRYADSVKIAFDNFMEDVSQEFYSFFRINKTALDMIQKELDSDLHKVLEAIFYSDSLMNDIVAFAGADIVLKESTKIESESGKFFEGVAIQIKVRIEGGGYDWSPRQLERGYILEFLDIIQDEDEIRDVKSDEEYLAYLQKKHLKFTKACGEEAVVLWKYSRARFEATRSIKRRKLN